MILELVAICCYTYGSIYACICCYTMLHIYIYMYIICMLFVFCCFPAFLFGSRDPRSETRDRCLFREICWRLIQSNTDGLVGVALWGNPWRCIPRCKMVQDSLQCLQCLCVSLQIWHIWNIWDRWDLETHHVQIIFRRGTKGFHIDVD